MSRQVTPFNRLEVTSGVLTRIQSGKDELIVDRLKDSVAQAGIAAPNGATARYLQAGCVNAGAGDPATQFAITPTAADKFTLGVGTAYDADGNRIAIPFGDVTSFNPNAPLFTASITGVAPIQPAAGPIPYSTGCVDAFDRGAGPPYTTPNTSDGERFVFIRYREVVLTKALPSNHAAATQTAVSIALTGASPNTKKPYTELDEKEGLIFAPHRVDGYEVIVAKTADVTLVPGDTPVLTAYPNAVYVGRYQLSGGILVGGSIVLSDSTYPRQLLQLRSREVGVVHADHTKGPIAYTDADQPVTLEEHVSALGSAGTVSPTNPHGLSINDIEGGGLEPQNRQWQADSLSPGIVDSAVSPNSPIPDTAAFDPIINNTASGSWLARVEFAKVTGTSIYLLGTRIDVEDIPTTEGPAVIGKFTMGFLAGSPGTYTIYVGLDITTPLSPIISLGKTTSFPPTPPSSTIAYFPLVTVYWSGSALRKTSRWDSSSASPTPDAQESTLRPRDRRTLGLVSTPQISTVGLSDPVSGLLARQAFQDGLFNPDFFLSDADLSGGLVTAPAGWTLNAAPFSPTGSATLARIDTSSAPYGPALPTDEPGPKAVSAARLYSITASGGVHHSQLLGRVANLKRNATYTITAWFKVTAPGTPGVASGTSITALGRLTDSTGAVSYTGLLKEFVLDTSIAGWQRAVLVVQTNGSPSPLTDARLDIRLISQTVMTFVSADVYITNVMITEGEWVRQFVRPKRVHRWSRGGVVFLEFIVNGNYDSGWANVLNASFMSTGGMYAVRSKINLRLGGVWVNNAFVEAGYYAVLDVGGIARDGSFGEVRNDFYYNIATTGRMVSFDLVNSWVGYVQPGSCPVVLRHDIIASTVGQHQIRWEWPYGPTLEVIEL